MLVEKNGAKITSTILIGILVFALITLAGLYFGTRFKQQPDRVSFRNVSITKKTIVLQGGVFPDDSGIWYDTYKAFYHDKILDISIYARFLHIFGSRGALFKVIIPNKYGEIDKIRLVGGASPKIIWQKT